MAKKDKGWIKLWRKIEDCDALECDRFDKFHAFVWLVEHANIGQKTTSYGERIKRGQLKTSIRILAREWGWDKDVVRRYLNRLEKEGMIRQNKTGKGTVLTVVRYGFYQDTADSRADTESDAKSDTKSDTKPPLLKKDRSSEKKPVSSPKGERPAEEPQYDLSIPEVETW